MNASTEGHEGGEPLVHPPALAGNVASLAVDCVTAAARALCKDHAEVCNVNADDLWNLESDDFKRMAALALGAANAAGWNTVERDGLPPLDGVTVFVGVNTAGFAACFNRMTEEGACLMGSAESCTCVMSCLRWWKPLDRPSGEVPVGRASHETGYAYPAKDAA